MYKIRRLVHCEVSRGTYDLLQADSADRFIEQQAGNMCECSQSCHMIMIRSTTRRYQRSTLTILGGIGNELDPNLVDILSER